VHEALHVARATPRAAERLLDGRHHALGLVAGVVGDLP
jgi:hypothetical protein